MKGTLSADGGGDGGIALRTNDANDAVEVALTRLEGHGVFGDVMRIAGDD